MRSEYSQYVREGVGGWEGERGELPKMHRPEESPEAAPRAIAGS